MPTILIELDPCAAPDSSLKKAYVYTPQGQILAQYDCNGYDDESNSVVVNGKYFYIHDRLGSVRLVIDTNSTVRNSYTYTPFGEMFASECNETVYNPFKFTGQWFDSEIRQYYLRARMYDPQIMRFTSMDSVKGNFAEPLTLHMYLYCLNEPINNADPSGLWRQSRSWNEDYDARETQRIILDATKLVGEWWKMGPFRAFGPIEFLFDFKFSNCTFTIGKSTLQNTEFGNYLAGYACYYNYGLAGDAGVRTFGHAYALGESMFKQFDAPGSRYFIAAGILKAQADLGGASGLFGRLTFINAKSDLGYGLARMCDTDIYSTDFDRELEMLTMFWNSGSLKNNGDLW